MHLWLGQASYEKALLEHACERAIKKEDINFFISGDLMNQIISSSFTARTLGIPFLGIFGACSSSMQSLSLAAQLIESKCAKYVIASASSHNAAAEKQFRYPTEYGGQKPKTAQWTVTGAGAFVPISSFGNTLVTGSLLDAEETGFIGIFTGVLKNVSSGVSAAITFGFIAALIFKPKG